MIQQEWKKSWVESIRNELKSGECDATKTIPAVTQQKWFQRNW